MNILALDTATSVASVAVVRDGVTVVEDHDVVTTHSSGLIALIERCLTTAGLLLSDIDAIVCGQGPGSFTGLRIGMATAKGLAFALRRPLVGASTLNALACGVSEIAGDGPIAAVIDAGRHEVYCGLFRSGRLQREIFSEKPEQLEKYLPDGPLLWVGNGAQRYCQLLTAISVDSRLSAPETHRVRADYLVRSMIFEADEPWLPPEDMRTSWKLAPIYIRSPDIYPQPPGRRLGLPGDQPGAVIPAHDRTKETLRDDEGAPQ